MKLYNEKGILPLLIIICSCVLIQGFSISKTANAQPALSPTLPFPQITSNPPKFKTTAACDPLAVSSVSASGSQTGNPATNAIDGDINTRWSNLGIGSSIIIDFGAGRAICNADIAWYRGNERTVNFVISVSNDGTTFNNVFTGTSSGTTADFESYDFPDTTGRYVKITVNGNSMNEWASVSEIRILGGPIPQPAPAPVVISTNPVDGATNIPLTSPKITATFNEPIQTPSVSSSTFTVQPSGSQSSIAGTYSLSPSDGGRTVIFTPSSNLNPSTTYVSKLTKGIKNQAGVSLDAVKTWSFTTAANSIPPPVNDCNKLSVSKITEDGGMHSLGPRYAIDGDPSTRWSNNGIGASITLDIGKKKVICNLEVSWYRGTERISKFIISVSRDGKDFTDIFSGMSSGSTDGFERYDFPDTNARYIKITVNGNSLNNWASITEVQVFGDPNNNNPNPPPSPPPNPPPGPPPTDNKINIAVAGDWGCSSDSQQTVDNMMQKMPELVLAMGDLSYKSSSDCWIKLISPLEAITKVTMGNHDEDEGNPSSLAASYLQEFGLSTSYYSFNFKNIHFLMMNSEIDFDTNSPQYSFVKNDLEIASSDKAIKWIVVGFHSPMYTSPSKHPPNTSFAAIYHPLFDQYGVDLVLQAHNHNYQRSYPLTFNDGKASSPIASTAEKNNYKNPNGEIYVVAGTAGRSLYPLNGKASFIVNQFEGFGFLNLEMSDDGNTLAGKFYSAKDDSIIDQFSITK